LYAANKWAKIDVLFVSKIISSILSQHQSQQRLYPHKASFAQRLPEVVGGESRTEDQASTPST
jgi:hypothetical protein